MTDSLVSEEVAIKIDSLIEENAQLTRRLLEIDDIGYIQLFGNQDQTNGVDIDTLNQLAGDFSDMAINSPLFRRAIQLRHAYVHGRGFDILGVAKKEHLDVTSNPYNRDSLFSGDAMYALEAAMLTHGNFFVLKTGRRSKTEYVVVPQEQIVGVITDENDAQRILYVKRSWTTNGTTKEQWIPLNRHKASGVKIPTSIANQNGDVVFTWRGVKAKPAEDAVQVSQDSTMFIAHNNRLAGHTWGVPLGAAIKIWVMMYTGYLKDNATLVKALSQIAWKVSTTSAKAAGKVATEVVQPKAGGTAITGANQDVMAMPRGNDVNFSNGQPIAAMIATAVGVPVIALISSTGASGGAYGAATTLDEPTQKGMMAVQTARQEFLNEILKDLAGEDAYVEFPTMAMDATYRHAQAIANGFATGAFHQIEYRNAMTQLLDVRPEKDGLPKANGFNSWSDPDADEKAAAAQDPVARQGNSGAVPGGNDQGDTNHDNDADRE
jgi:hypothetical protein